MVLADVHSHILYGVDDGAKSKAVMLSMLDKAYQSGVRRIFVSPHYNPELFEYLPQSEDKAFDEICEYAKEKYPDMELYRWNEIYIFSDVPSFLKDKGRTFLADTKNVLIEFSPHVAARDVANALVEIRALGLKAVIAHVERYVNLTLDDIAQLKDMGAVITVNAESIIGNNGRSEKRCARKAVKYGLVDIVASDAHKPTEYDSLREAAKFIIKKYGEETAELLLWGNADRLLKKENV